MASENAITPGAYRAKAKAFKFGKTPKGNEQIYIDFELSSGAHAGKHLPCYLYFTDKTAERTLESLEYCGWDGGSLKELKGLGSKEVELVVEYEQGNDGNQYLRVKWVNSTGGGVKEELDQGGLTSLEQRMKGLMLQRSQKRQQGKPMREPGDDTPEDFGPTDYDGMPPV
jgi:hypothetical protein